MQTSPHPNGSSPSAAARPAAEVCHPLERLGAAERHVLDALATAREALVRCEQALALLFEARSIASIAPAAPGQTDQLAGLTAREAEILGLIAAGKSNRQIAEALFLSPRTVERHIANLYPKIDVHNKAEATAWALRHALD